MSLSDTPTLEPNTEAAESPAAIAARLAARFAETAAARDLAGGTPKAERDLLRAISLGAARAGR